MEYPDVIPMLSYEDGQAAMDWLIRSFGFIEKTRWLDPDGRLTHGELIAGSGLLMLAMPTADYQSPRHHRSVCTSAAKWSECPYVIDGVLVYVEDVESHYTAARAAGAVILSDIEEGGPGKRYRAEDCEGHRWMFMQRGNGD